MDQIMLYTGKTSKHLPNNVFYGSIPNPHKIRVSARASVRIN